MMADTSDMQYIKEKTLRKLRGFFKEPDFKIFQGRSTTRFGFSG